MGNDPGNNAAAPGRDCPQNEPDHDDGDTRFPSLVKISSAENDRLQANGNGQQPGEAESWRCK